MQILVIGTGCAKCKTLAQFTEQAVKDLGLAAEINKVTDLKQIMALGVMITPALAIDGSIKVSGKVPTIAELKVLLKQAAEAEPTTR
jgi:small redox-active disulfide protein 2